MKKPRYSVSVPGPCHENWDKMLPADKDRHCLACQKTVIDFSKMNDEDIIEVIKNTGSNMCGRFAYPQLDRPLQPYIVRHRNQLWHRVLLMAVLGIFNIKNDGKAIASTETVMQMTDNNEDVNASTPSDGPDVDSTNDTINGVVIDSETHEPLEMVDIWAEGDKTGTTFILTNEEGKFSVRRGKNNSITLRINYLGYESKTVNITVSNGSYKTITLKESGGMVGGVMIVTKEVEQPALERFIKGTWYRLRKLGE